MRNNRGFLLLLAVNIALFLGDFGSTLRLGSAAKILEANPIYVMTGSFLPIILLNVLLFATVVWAYHHAKIKADSRYLLILLLTFIILLRIFAISNAVLAYENPEMVEETIQMVTENPEMKQEFIMNFMLIGGSYWLFGLITYLFWRLDHNATKKG